MSQRTSQACPVCADGTCMEYDIVSMFNWVLVDYEQKSITKEHAYNKCPQCGYQEAYGLPEEDA